MFEQTLRNSIGRKRVGVVWFVASAVLVFFSEVAVLPAGAVTIDAFGEAFGSVLDNLMTNYWSEEENGDWMYDEFYPCGGYDAPQYSTELLYQMAWHFEEPDPIYADRADRTVGYVIEMAKILPLLQKIVAGGDITEEGASLPALLYGHRYYSGPLTYSFDTELPLLVLLSGTLMKQGTPLSEELNGYSGPAVVAYYGLILSYTFRDQGSASVAGLLARQAYELFDLTGPYWIQVTEDAGYFYDPAGGSNSIWAQALAVQALALAYQSSGKSSYLDRLLDMLGYLEGHWDESAPYGYCDIYGYCGSKTLSVNHLMAKALLILYDATGEREWLERAQQTIGFMTDAVILKEDARFPGFSIIRHDWSPGYDETCSCSGCNFAVLAVIFMYNRLEQEGPKGLDLLPTCVIATSTMGAGMAGKIEILRQFRDRHLLTNPMGASFVNKYYQYGPPVAEYIAKREWLKAIVRILLLPLIGFVTLLV